VVETNDSLLLLPMAHHRKSSFEGEKERNAKQIFAQLRLSWMMMMTVLSEL